jgi:hypothetical protein
MTKKEEEMAFSEMYPIFPEEKKSARDEGPGFFPKTCSPEERPLFLNEDKIRRTDKK